MPVLIILLVLLIVFCIAKYNSMIKAKRSVIQTRASIDVYLQQRFDLIPNLIEVVKGYMNHEKEILENVTALRTQYMNNKELKVSSELENGLNHILIMAENYPELKSSEQFLSLQQSLNKMESQLQAARRIYNTSVTNYNTMINIFPNNLLASLFGFHDEELFKLSNEEAKENIKVTF